MGKKYEEYLDNALELAEKSEDDQEKQGALIQEALNNLDLAYAANSKDYRAPFHKGVFLYRQEKYQEALDALKLSSNLYGHDPETFYYLARINQELGNTTKAQHLLWQAIYICCAKNTHSSYIEHLEEILGYSLDSCSESSNYIEYLESMLDHSHPARKTLENFQCTGEVSIIKEYLIQNCADSF